MDLVEQVQLLLDDPRVVVACARPRECRQALRSPVRPRNRRVETSPGAGIALAVSGAVHGLLIAFDAVLRRRCQRADLLGAHPVDVLARRQIRRALHLLRLLRAHPPGGPRLGEASRFAPGGWVRVKDEARIRPLLDARERTRGLQFTAAQFHACGGTYRVERVVTRLRDDNGRFRAVSRTVLLDGVDCSIGGPELACGRHCPLLFRDEWLEPAESPRATPPAPPPQRHARVRAAKEIARGLDLHGRRDGLSFMPEMAAYAGRRLPIIGQLERVFELDRSTAPRAPIYLLGGAHCSGAICGSDGPCERACTLMWHAEWLSLEPP